MNEPTIEYPYNIDIDHEMREMEETYAQWQEEERKHVHLMSVHRILDTLGDSETDQKEREYQLLRLEYSPVYFSGHMDYRGERLVLDARQYECAVKMLGVLGMIGMCC
jgi:hypothetical protein